MNRVLKFTIWQGLAVAALPLTALKISPAHATGQVNSSQVVVA